jgi:prevent-host-death family protein
MTMVIDHGHNSSLCLMSSSTRSRVVQASTFKAQCLALLDEVADSGQSIVVTKRGRPVARLVPIEDAPAMIGTVTLLADDDEDYFTTGEPWDASV